MRYFLLFDELSDPEGDLYRWNGYKLQMKTALGEYSDYFDLPEPGETVEELVQSLAGPAGRFEEVASEPA